MENQVINKVDYKLLTSGEIPVIFFGENHYNTTMFFDIGSHANIFKRVGVKAFLIEADYSQDFSLFNDGDFSIKQQLNFGPSMTYKSISVGRRNMLSKIVLSGIPIIPIDDPIDLVNAFFAKKRSDQEILQFYELREQNLTSRISHTQQKLGKVVVLLGMSHARRGIKTNILEQPYTEAIEKLELDFKVECRSVFFTGGRSNNRNKQLDQFLAKHYLPDKKVMFQTNTGDTNSPYFEDRPDWIVHFPYKKTLQPIFYH